MAYVSYAVAEPTDLGPRSVGAFDPRESAVSMPAATVSYTPDERVVVDESIKQRLWDRLAPYRVGMTDAEAGTFTECAARTLSPDSCRQKVLAARTSSPIQAGIPLRFLIGGGFVLLGAIWYVTKR